MTPFPKKTVFVTLAFAVWISLAFAGVLSLWTYKYSPGRPSVAVDDWPTDSRIARTRDRPILLVFVHPQCPCNSASYFELEKILGSEERSLDCVIVVYRPRDEEATSWIGEDSHRAARATGGRLVVDDDGRESRLFDATTSGHVMLFSRRGRMLFSGGITPSRGNSGDNLGARLLAEEIDREALGDERPIDETPRIAPVFGCGLPGGDR